MTPASTTEGGQSISTAPSVCYVPAPPVPAGPGGIPTPFPNVASHGSAEGVTQKVFIRNKPCLVEGSSIPSSSGDEAGCSQNLPPGKKGLKSMENLGKCEFPSHHATVKLEGKGAIVHLATTKQNNGNTVGQHASPSQTKVIIR